MTSNWKTVRNTLVWLIVAVITMGIVISSPYIIKSSAASLPTVKSCKGLTVQKSGKDWVTVNAKGAQVNYTGVASNKFGWWRVENGKVNFKATGIYQNDYGWWCVESGKVNFKANEIYQNSYGWWKTTDGKVTFKENGVFQNRFGWWKVKDSKVDFSFTGIGSNRYGTWYIKEGKVRFDANYSSYSYKGKHYYINEGRATEISSDSDNWKEEIVAIVKMVIREKPTSRAMMIDVLKDYYTEEQAVYGVDNSGIDWNLQAVLIADGLIYVDEDDTIISGISEAKMKEALKNLLFTDENIAHVTNIINNDDASFWNKQALKAATKLKKAIQEDHQTLTDDDYDAIQKGLEAAQFTKANVDYAMAQIKK